MNKYNYKKSDYISEENITNDSLDSSNGDEIMKTGATLAGVIFIAGIILGVFSCTCEVISCGTYNTHTSSALAEGLPILAVVVFVIVCIVALVYVKCAKMQESNNIRNTRIVYELAKKYNGSIKGYLERIKNMRKNLLPSMEVDYENESKIHILKNHKKGSIVLDDVAFYSFISELAQKSEYIADKEIEYYSIISENANNTLIQNVLKQVGESSDTD